MPGLSHRSGSNIVNWGRERIPPRSEIFCVYGTIVFLIYGWASVAFFWKLPGWLYFLSLSELAVIAAYILTSNLLESLALLLVFLIACVVLPPAWLRNEFATRGALTMYSLSMCVGLLNLSTLLALPTGADLFSTASGFLLTAGFALWLDKRIPVVHRLMADLGNRMIIFLYLWIPLSLIGLLVVVIRLFGRSFHVL